jgi:plastocyanin
MTRLYAAIGVFTVLLPAAGADITGHALVTKRLTRKGLSPIIYNLRGAAPPVASAEKEGGNEYDRMVVILEGGSPASKPPITATLNQRDIRFDPEIVVVPVGSTVEFPNSDPIFHNVFSLSKAQPFDLGFYPKGQSRAVKFNRPGIVQVYCHLHANMYAAIVVTASPWYTTPASDGSFSWSGVPAGHYRLTAWHKVAGLHRVDVDVPETGSVEVNIRVPVDVGSRP